MIIDPISEVSFQNIPFFVGAVQKRNPFWVFWSETSLSWMHFCECRTTCDIEV